MRGYLNRPEDTAKTIIDGWLHTGDVGIFDEDGYLRIVDRIKDMIIRGGENIYPKEIETVLYSNDAVLEAAVVGQADDVLGEAVVAYVSSGPGRLSRSRSSRRCAPSGAPSTSARWRSSSSTSSPRITSARSTSRRSGSVIEGERP